MKEKYKKYLYYPYKQIKEKTQPIKADRADTFQSFAALTGFEDLIKIADKASENNESLSQNESQALEDFYNSYNDD